MDINEENKPFLMLIKGSRFGSYAVEGEVDPETNSPIIVGVPTDAIKNKDDIEWVLDQYRASKRIKNCTKLKLNKDEVGCYSPTCMDDSLRWLPCNIPGKQDCRLLLGCPGKCRFYLPRWKKVLYSIFPASKAFLSKCLSVIWREFNSQPVLIKATVLIILGLLISPNKTQAVVAIINTLHCK